MAVKTGATLTGDKALQKIFKELPDQIQRRVLRGALLKSAKPIVRDAKSRIHKVTGNLQASIGAQSLKRGRGDRGNEVAVAVSARVGGGKSGKGYHAHLVEFGTSKMSARPFLRPATDTKRGEQQSILAKEVKIRIGKEADKLVRKYRNIK